MTTPTDLPARVEEALALNTAAVAARYKSYAATGALIDDFHASEAERKASLALRSTLPALAADWQRLRERERVLTEALQAVHDWRGLCDSDADATFERIASMFHAETAYLRLGKDCRLHDFETRLNAWDAWVERKNNELNARIRAALSPEPKT